MTPKFLIIIVEEDGVKTKSSLPLHFHEINGKAILEKSIESFIAILPDIKIILVLPSKDIPYWKDYCSQNNFYYRQSLVEGGFTRFHSMKRALEKVPDGALVAIQDGLRPIVSRKLLMRFFSVFDNSEEVEAVVPVIPLNDGFKIGVKQAGVYDLHSRNRLDRNDVFCIQTPQIYSSELIKKAYSQPYDINFTDDSSVVEAMEKKIKYLDGERTNIKITSLEDVILAKAILSFVNRT